MTRNAKTTAGVSAASAPDAPPAGQPGPLAAAPPGGPAPAIVAALVAAPGATAAQLAQAAGISRPAATRELAALEKGGHATRDRSMSSATWTAGTCPMRRQGQTALNPSACRTPPRSPRRTRLPRTRKRQEPGIRTLSEGTPGPPPRPARQASRLTRATRWAPPLPSPCRPRRH